MNPFDIIWDAFAHEFQNTEFWIPGVVGVSLACGSIWLMRWLKVWRYKIGLIAMTVGLVAAEFNLLMKWNYLPLYYLAGFLLLLPILFFLIPFLWNQHRFSKIRKLCGKQLYIEALELLNTIKSRWLTAKQLRTYQRKRFALLLQLGSLQKAKSYLDEICPEKGAFYHVALHILAFTSGDLQTSSKEIQAAKNSSDFNREPSLQFQIMMNHGVCYAADGKYHLADESFRKAIAFYDDKNLQDEELLCTFYYNFAYNNLRLNPETADWKRVLDECQARLNMKKSDAQIRMLNLRLELLRQTEAPREITDKLLQEAFATISEGKLPLKNQVFFASSAVRVAWAAQVNPFPFLNLLKENQSIIESLSAHQRYRVYVDLDTLFRDLHGPANTPFESLRNRAADYLKYDAEKDLRQWQQELPEDAVYARCDCLNKLAVLHRNKTPYHRDTIISFQQNAARLYHDNELYVNELHVHHDIMDELLDQRNRDENHQPTCVDELRDHLSAAENLLSQLAGHPALVEIYIRLSCYCIELHEYEKSLYYVRLFRSTDISVQNFAPWVRRYYATLLLHTRVILFDQAIKKASGDKRLCTFKQDIQDWFSTYPNHDGFLDALLLGRFLSVPIGKTRVWIPDGEAEPQGHTWLWIPHLNLNIDLTYPQFADDQLCQCIFFYEECHPFESGTSLTLQISQQKCSMIFHGIIGTQLGENLSPEDTAFINSIYDFICNHIPEDCPTMEEFHQLYQEFVVPVPIHPQTS